MSLTILVRYDEIGTKGKNRAWFEDLLVRNIVRGLGPDCAARKFRGRIELTVVGDMTETTSILALIPGISSFSPAQKLPIDASWEDIEQAALPLADRAIAEGRTVFRTTVTRSNKKYPSTSIELQKRLAASVLKARDGRFTVSMTRPNFTLEMEIDGDAIYLFSQRIAGTLGLPVGCAGEMLTLLSGGIDSPVAAYLMMRRGARSHYISFHSPPYTTEESMRKLHDLAATLRRFQGEGSRLYIVPFIDLQLLVRARAIESYRTILFRRLMFRLAEHLALRDRYTALVTGESLSQVASQTIENITAIGDAVRTLPVLRPLIAYEKQETIAVARRIGTFDISIRPCPDSCTAFLPRNPATRGKLDLVHAQEEKLLPDIDALIEAALAGTVTTDV